MALTTKQWQLYNLIKKNSLECKKTTQLEICNSIEGYEYRDRKGTTDKCSAIWVDVKEINMSGEVDKIIITKRYTYWIGNEEETEEYLKACWNAIAPALKRYWNLVRKAKLNGQYRWISTKGDIIDADSKARDYVESFIDAQINKAYLNKLSYEDVVEVYKKTCQKYGEPILKYHNKERYIEEILYLQKIYEGDKWNGL